MDTEYSEWDSLLHKKLTNTLSEEEGFAFDRQLQTDSTKRAEYDHVNRLWMATGKLTLQKGQSRDVRWKNLTEKIQSEEKVKPLYARPWIRYAASLAAILVLASMYMLITRPRLVEVSTAYGETKSITLPDQSVVTLNAGTTIQYDPSGWDEERSLLLAGEAYFDVQKNGIPFTVASVNAKINVLGTSFNVRVRKQTTSVVCVTGKVRVSEKTEDKKFVILTRGNAATVRDHTLSAVYEVPAEEATRWINGDLVFRNTPLKEVFADLERHYNKIIIAKGERLDRSFTGTFRKQEFNNVLTTICLSAGLTCVTSNDSTIQIQ